MQTYRVETIISQNRVLTYAESRLALGKKSKLSFEPFPANEGSLRYPLHGKPVRYIRPFDSVAEDEWQALR